MITTILVIEDNPEMCDNISSILELNKYKVLTAIDGKTGVELAYENKPDLILCDIMMPELDGYGVLHILSKHPETSDIPFIFLTAKAEQTDFRKGMSLGADDYITKPFDGLDLLRAVETRLKKNEKLKSAFGGGLTEDIDQFLEKAQKYGDLENLSENRIHRTYGKKEIIFREGQHPTFVFYVVKGEVKSSRVSYDGKELITGLYNEGDFFGYVPILKNTPYEESAIALSEVELGIIPKHDFHKLVYTNREIAARFIRMMANNLYDTEKRLLDLAYQSVRQRVASAIIRLFHQEDERANSGHLIKLPRKDMASIVGTALESLNRTISDFKEEGLIEVVGNGIKILEMGKLEKLGK
ncbi:response regulator [Echinicola jeungdonensis]|uniref:Response regulator n=1 Tax=Echinicola jeungdonensis TaxID=709343 RepID=A0ABV5J975_9BACT|nr:response regulator [Echinicola jeungdonensis]MDN3670522.1 response regulator [Echinicola jeungdonensis]